VRHLYRHALNGYSTNLTASQAARLRSQPGVAAPGSTSTIPT
jgi:hypothetical protein